MQALAMVIAEFALFVIPYLVLTISEWVVMCHLQPFSSECHHCIDENVYVRFSVLSDNLVQAEWSVLVCGVPFQECPALLGLHGAWHVVFGRRQRFEPLVVIARRVEKVWEEGLLLHLPVQAVSVH